MSEEELQLLITLDDPGDAPEEDTFNHLQAKNTLEYWLGQRFRQGVGSTNEQNPLTIMTLAR
jgi:hypothetical protein